MADEPEITLEELRRDLRDMLLAAIDLAGNWRDRPAQQCLDELRVRVQRKHFGSLHDDAHRARQQGGAHADQD